jgi:hypothetical protein
MALTTAAPAPDTFPFAAPRRPRRWTWIYDAPSDLATALGWIPIFVVALVAVSIHGDRDLLPPLVALALFASAMHQPLTLGLVYGDPDQRAAHRRLFRWAPLVVVGTVVAATQLTPLLVIPVAAAWNTVHTLQQRYGLCRIYSRRAGYGSARLDRSLLYSALGAALVFVASHGGIVDLVARAHLAGRNGAAVRDLAAIGTAVAWLLWPALLAVAALAVSWVRVEQRAGPSANPARWLYMGSSLALIAGIAVAPAAGFVAYLAAHTIEYVIVVHHTAVRRGADPASRGAIARSSGRPVLVGLGMLFVMLPVAVAHLVVSLETLSILLACVGALHFLYDGVIWKLRRPAVAQQFAIAAP